MKFLKFILLISPNFLDMKHFIRTLFIVTMISTAVACTSRNEQSKDTGESTEAAAENVKYTCTMHPEVISDKPGKCPKCGMELVKKEDSDSDSSNHQHD
jgi:hypothetical protein